MSESLKQPSPLQDVETIATGDTAPPETPNKELMDCVMGDRDFEKAIKDAYVPLHPMPEINYYVCGIIAKEQLKFSKLQDYIKAQVQSERAKHIERLKDLTGIDNISNARILEYINELRGR